MSVIEPFFSLTEPEEKASGTLLFGEKRKSTNLNPRRKIQMHTCKVVFSVPRNKKMFSSQLQVGEKKGKESHWGSI